MERSRQPASPASPLLEVRHLSVSFTGERERVTAVDGVTFSVFPDQTVALVGESGCGKSVSALSILRLVPRPAGRIDGGEVLFQGRNLLDLTEDEMLRVRGGEIAMIFQEPITSLNPVYSIGDQLVEAIRLHQSVDAKEAHVRAVEAMKRVGIARPEQSLNAYPHELSGGMCQRAMTAMALACEPRILIADEPTTALDVTIQAQILELLRSLQRRTGMSIVLITHDLGVVAQSADVVAVMYAGRVVEVASVFDLFDRPYHPYTRGLFSSIPRIEARRHRLLTVAEQLSDPTAFQHVPGHQYGLTPWWPHAAPPDDLVLSEKPGRPPEYRLVEVEPEHWVGCWRTQYVADHPARPPMLAFRREERAVTNPG